MLAIKFKPLSNNLKKYIQSLKKKEVRIETGMFIAEGFRLCKELLTAEVQIELVVISSDSDDETVDLAKAFVKKGVDVFIARRQQYVQLCETTTPQSILAVVKEQKQITKLTYPLVVLESISDPGNLGTIIRTANWFGISNIVTTSDSVDKFNSKVIRGSMGAFFRVNISQTDNLIEFLAQQRRSAKIYAALPDAELNLKDIKFPGNSILVFGNEARGISNDVLNVCDYKFRIPGAGNIESLNVAISVSIVLFWYFINSKK